MLNLPSHPGITGFVLLGVGAVVGSVSFLLLRARVAAELGSRQGDALTLLVAGTTALTFAAAPFVLWRVAADIRETAPITAEHARFVGAETKLIDGELVERMSRLVPNDATYAVAVAPNAHEEIRESLARWLGYALIPRRQLGAPSASEWVVVWGASPSSLGIRAAESRLVGRNRLVDREPVYLARPPG